jgi:hypothetical protein
MFSSNTFSSSYFITNLDLRLLLMKKVIFFSSSNYFSNLESFLEGTDLLGY